MKGFGDITQLGYLTDDIEAAATLWAKVLGVGPWTRMNGVKMPATMDGQTVEIQIDVALAYQGDVQIELIKPLCGSPSPYQKNKEIGLWGAHHTQFTVDDLDGAVEGAEVLGMETACVISSSGARYIYLRSASGWIELTTPNAGLQPFYDMIKSSCETWDGQVIWSSFSG